MWKIDRPVANIKRTTIVLVSQSESVHEKPKVCEDGIVCVTCNAVFHSLMLCISSIFFQIVLEISDTKSFLPMEIHLMPFFSQSAFW